ncbi:hypothetical protein ACFR9U_19880 [Halorientalis brevis]|uniref:Fenitrothion hydrolase n=1 Tax=Halorientalis brevis TaxID=1126241 RepID=A0ABD6CHB8_9EURY|nr:hypothetical protein [Halorientalis brevis]
MTDDPSARWSPSSRSSLLAARRAVVRLLALTLAGVLFVGVAAAHGGSLGASAREELTVPTWLFLLTGGSAVGASFLLASFVTDRALIREIHTWYRTSPVPARRIGRWLGHLAGVVGLAAILGVGFVGPPEPLANLAILTVWVGWWAGFTMTTYLLGNAWPVVNPWRTISSLLPSLDRAYPDGLGAWPSVVGLLALVWLEVVSPLADEPQLLATVIVGYSALTLAGAFVVGPARWFGTVDPVARVFRYYGRVAPLTWDDEASRLRLRLPGTALSETRFIDGFDEVAFVVAIVWVTTYDGLVSTPAWAGFARAVVGVGVPPALLYPATLLVGFVAFLGVYWLAAGYSRQLADSYRTKAFLARRFAPSLLAIAAGYHLAHYLGYFLSLFPAALAALQDPLPASAPTTVPVAQLPGWFGGLNMTFVLLGHLLAIWVAHATAFEVFPGRLQAIKSQYSFTLVMVLYTMTSLWVVSQPTIQPPFL